VEAGEGRFELRHSMWVEPAVRKRACQSHGLADLVDVGDARWAEREVVLYAAGGFGVELALEVVADEFDDLDARDVVRHAAAGEGS
jgi:hypothetical protein